MEETTRKLGPYRLLKKIGRGAFGVVWLAEKKTAITTTRVALKLPSDEDVDLDAFRQEAEIWVHASGHQNVVSLIEADIYDEQIVIVSEYVPDGSLATWLKQSGGKAPSVESACEMIDGVLAGLAHLHERHILHRDLKPDNILLQGDTPRLADFGISRLLRTDSYTTSTSGTPAYKAPEAFDGKSNERTDLWAAGVIFYQLLAGRLPYDQRDPSALFGAIMRFDAPPLPQSVPEVLQRIVVKALQRDASKRYATAAEMRQDLREAERSLWRGELPTVPAEPLVQTTLPGPLPVVPPLIDPDILPKLPSPSPAAIPKPGRPVAQRKPGSWVVPLVVLLLVAVFATLGIVFYKIYVRQNSSGEMGQGQPANNSNSAPSASTPASSASSQSASSVSAGTTMTNKIGMQFVAIPAGSFKMGSTNSDEQPVHDVTISQPFYMGKYEVTQAQWQAVMGSNPANFKGDNLPVEQVGWDDATVFIAQLNARNDAYSYRLPSEAEWEYACRAGTTGDYAGDLDGMAWYGKNSGNKTHEVGTKLPNALGLFDMHGNVWEWCQDWYHGSYNGAPTDGSAWLTGGEQRLRVKRGASWSGLGSYLRSAYRGGAPAYDRDDHTGFRLVAVVRTQ